MATTNFKGQPVKLIGEFIQVILERVRGYEAIFEETLSEKEIYDIIK